MWCVCSCIINVSFGYRNKRQEGAGSLSTVIYGLDRSEWVIIDVLSVYVCIMPKTLWKVINTYAQLACELHVRSSRNFYVIKCPISDTLHRTSERNVFYIMQIGSVINILIVSHMINILIVSHNASWIWWMRMSICFSIVDSRTWWE